MLCHDVGDILKHLKREHIEVGGTLIPVSDSFSKRIEILIDISMELDAINTRNGGKCLEWHLLSVNLNLPNHTHNPITVIWSIILVGIKITDNFRRNPDIHTGVSRHVETVVLLKKQDS
ncbi:hypothetical protein SG0102_18190 [Intestinibaculum porci]|uniref:Uncharacterized protein n=1 Tax=Intestinibaculum porci TaxID=2487118 RepID=A0A3G9JEU0_9FIRM|nr:hypothetical protein SG0102_18190 [Intestinibaculum porci]